MRRSLTNTGLVLLPLLSALMLALVYGEGFRRMLLQEPDARPRMGTFDLVTTDGKPFTRDNVAGRPLAVFFGFTSCPDICPTTLAELTTLIGDMGDAANELTPLFISVDPERDIDDILRAYMTSFDPRIIALRGSPTQTRQAAKAFHATYRKVPLGDGSYTMDHTAGVWLVRADGIMQGTLDMHESRDIRLQKLINLAHSTRTHVGRGPENGLNVAAIAPEAL